MCRYQIPARTVRTGYVEGQNIVIEFGLAQSAAQLPDMAAALARLKVDVLVASGMPSVLPGQECQKDDSNRAAIDPVVPAALVRIGTPPQAQIRWPADPAFQATWVSFRTWDIRQVSTCSRATCSRKYGR